MFVVYSGVNVTFAAQKVNCLPGNTRIAKLMSITCPKYSIAAQKQPAELLF